MNNALKHAADLQQAAINDYELRSLRRELVMLAHSPGASPQEVVERVACYYRFVTDSSAGETA